MCPDQRAALRPNQRGSGVWVGVGSVGWGGCNRNCLPRPSVRPSRLAPSPPPLPPSSLLLLLPPPIPPASGTPSPCPLAATFTARCFPRPLHCANVTGEDLHVSRGSACKRPVLCISHRHRLCRHALAAVGEGSAPWVRGGCDPGRFLRREEYADPRGRCGLCGALRLPFCATTVLRPRGERVSRCSCTQFPRPAFPPACLPCRPFREVIARSRLRRQPGVPWINFRIIWVMCLDASAGGGV